MTLTDTFLSGIMLMKILYKVNSDQRKFLVDMLKRYFAGNETNFGNTIAAMSFNDYAMNIPENGTINFDPMLSLLNYDKTQN